MYDDARITAATDHLVAATARLRQSLERLSDDAATTPPAQGGWTPAQIVYHVGITNEGFFLPTFAGTAEFLAPAHEGFEETFAFETVPPRIKTFPQLEPPDVGKADALRKLDASAAAVADALRALPPERVRQCAQLPFGTLSMQQMAEFAAGHVVRHQAQLDRALTTGA
jgi:uncharacterized damage-inducible protein DinB